jgi:hypothetical protein
VVWKDEEYDSRKEMEYAMYLESEHLAGRLNWWRPHIPVRLEVNGKLIRQMEIDFKVEYPDGHQEFHEVKGEATKIKPDYVMARKLFEALFPDAIYKIIE